MDTNERVALALLRFSLGLFLLLWGVDKILVPEATAGIFERFYRLPLPVAWAPVVGVAEGLLGLALLLGAFKTLVYGSALAVHTVSTISTLPLLLDPFGENHLFIAAIPVWGAFLALFLLRRRDMLWTVSR